MADISLIFPNYALDCINNITAHGFEAYFVGGCVRDGLLSRKCDDIDITTNASPEQIISIFEHTVPTGIKHGTVTVILDNHTIEVTTYRKDNSYSDSRHPDNVTFVSDIHLDLSRRDFTVNALAYNTVTGLLDAFSGLDDLNAKLIKAVGDPRSRFEEDALRILRAFRFASCLNFEIESNTLDAALMTSDKLKNISGERVLSEISKLACGINPRVVLPLLSLNSLSSFGIGAAKHNLAIIKDAVGLEKIQKTALFISLCEHNCDLIRVALKPSKELLEHLIKLDKLESEAQPETKANLKLLLSKYGRKTIEIYLYKLPHYKEMFGFLNEIDKNNEPFKISQLAIDGNDLLKAGHNGSTIGVLLNKALRLVIKDSMSNNRQTLLDYLKE